MTTTTKQTIQIQLHADHRCQYFKNMILLIYIMKDCKLCTNITTACNGKKGKIV